MRKSLFTLLFISGMIFLLPMAFAQEGKQVSDKASAAIGKSDAHALAALLSERVDMELPGKQGIYSRTQAELILKDFFRQNPISSFTIRHSGSSGEGAMYTIGSCTSGGKTFRVYFLIKKNGASYLLNQLRFETES